MNICTTAKTVALSIAGIAGLMSYGHQVDLLGSADLGMYAYAVPLTVDLLAFIGATVRHSDTVTDSTRKAALVPLILAGAAAIAANVAVAVNVVQVAVGIWTVGAYLIAEFFVSRLKAKPAAVDSKRSEAAKRGHQTRKSNATKRKPRTPVEKVQRLKTPAPVSPAVGYAG